MQRWLEGQNYNLVTIVVAITGVAIAFAAAYLAYRALPARRLISVQYFEVFRPPPMRGTRFIHKMRRALNGLLAKILRIPGDGEEPLLLVTIRNLGREDVSSEHFDRGRPIALNMQALIGSRSVLDQPQIVEVSGGPIAVTVRGEYLEIGPDLINQGKSYRIWLKNVRSYLSFPDGTAIAGQWGSGTQVDACVEPEEVDPSEHLFYLINTEVWIDHSFVSPRLLKKLSITLKMLGLLFLVWLAVRIKIFHTFS